MLEHCPNYNRCDANTRQVRGSSEHYCLGSLNWEFCPQFKDILLSGGVLHGFGRDEDIIQVARSICRIIHSKLQKPLIIAILTYQGEKLYQDQQWNENYLLAAQNIARYMIDTNTIGEYFKVENLYKFLFFNITEEFILLFKTEAELEEVISVIQEQLSNFQMKLKDYFKTHPLPAQMEGAKTPEEGLILDMFVDLRQKLEVINPEIVIQDLFRIQQKISKFFSWNRILYEISILIEKLKEFPAGDELDSQEKEEILGKIKEWQQKIQQEG